MISTENYSKQLNRLIRALQAADAVLIGAGAGLSAAAGFTYTGARFMRFFSDFYEKYGITDMYAGGFYPFETQAEYWAWWSRQIYVNRYAPGAQPLYIELLKRVLHKPYFVLTTNVDHQFQLAGFDKQRLFYTQGDYGLWQCSRACHAKTYDNEARVREMVQAQKNMKVPDSLLPYCPVCGAPMSMNLRMDETFVQDDGWYQAAKRYENFILRHQSDRLVLLELGVGARNTPGIIRYPFLQQTAENPNAFYACVNLEAPALPAAISDRCCCLNTEIQKAVADLPVL